ncbi:MAG: hypothetical protein ACEY3B_06265, partial [Wolbachia sp.]
QYDLTLMVQKLSILGIIPLVYLISNLMLFFGQEMEYKVGIFSYQCFLHVLSLLSETQLLFSHIT